MANVLTIGGSDPCTKAGVQTDLEVIRAVGHHGLCAITAVTAQNDNRVYALNAVGTKVLNDQLRAITDQYEIGAVKIGLLATRELAYQVYRFLCDKKPANVVVDPIIRSSSGALLLENAALSVLSSFIFPLSKVVTPNLDEAEVLSGMIVRSPEQMADAARKIYGVSSGVGAVLVKGGHLKDATLDILFDGKDFREFPSDRVYPVNVRGTGCILSSAIASFLAGGDPVQNAVQKAKRFLDEFVASRV